MNEEQAYLVELLQSSVNSVYQEERFLLRFAEGDREGLEQAFVFRTGVYLSRLLQGTEYEALDLDSEYNKNHGNTKTSRRFLGGIRPDLIIHQRDSHNENKLVAEFKGWWHTGIENDIMKLEDLTNPEDQYHYLVGVLVIINREAADFRYFINGQQI